MGENDDRKYKVVGTRPIRHDGVDKVTGRASFGADLALPGMLHGAILRSPHAHAKILRIDTSKAAALPGVKAVMTSADLPDIPRGGVQAGESQVDPRDLSHNILARGKVLYHGHAVAAVAATTIERAREACELIEVEYEPLRPVLSLDEALAKDAPILDPERKPGGVPPLPQGPSNVAKRFFTEGGDLEAGFSDADVVLEGVYETPFTHQGYIEPHACVASTREDGKVEIWCCTQGPFLVKGLIAMVLQWDPNRIRVIPSEIGGGFGGKTTIYLEPVAAVLSQMSGRPVKMVMTREEVFRASGPTSAARVRVKIGAKRDGTFVAGDTKLEYEAGAFPGSPVMAAFMCAFASYKLPNFRIEGLDIVVNKPKVAAYRAPGAPNAAFAVESLIDDLARELRIDPIELRLKNAVAAGDRATYGPVYDRIGFKETLEAARAHPHYKAPLGPNQGRGVGAGFWFNVGLQSSATVSLNEDGSAVVRTGSPDIGGSRASMAITVAEELGIPVERVRPLVGDTDTVGYCDVTGGSRTTYAGSMAVIEACKQIVEHLRARAATIWDVEIDAVEWKDGFAVGTNGASDKKPLSLAEIAKQMGHTGGPIVASGAVNLPAAGPGFGVHLCDVEVDRETGRLEVVRYTAIQDAGKAVHPTYVEGQLQGGAVQGIGMALWEEYLFDAEGRMENPGFLDYRMPVASDLPMIDAVIVEVPNPLHPYGVRGVGETPIVPPLATVANAVRDATGIRFHRLPITPVRVLEALEGGEG
ncbi:MAG: xanthine dehydrogenase family protein molybdopterin-binding subunit [Spirochaetaceae bacterium]|nr:xanthine dehydrogenase family protein molybdopterin-binding subunit [Spirochaetaceae bacterium]